MPHCFRQTQWHLKMTEKYKGERESLIKTACQSENLLVGILIVMAVGLSGCASQAPARSEQEFATTMAQAEARVATLLQAENREEAVRTLTDIARANPARKEPWLRMAKMYFDDARYSMAIVSAEETLQRDRTDQTAKSIRAVSGLRVASQSLTDLRSDVELQGNARADATGLAMVMRDILGEDVLVPPAELEARKKREATVRRKAATRTRQAAPVRTNGAAQTPPEAASGGNPFSILK